MTYQIIYEEDAINDLANIARYYYEQGDMELSDNIIDRILDNIDKLEFMPQRCVNCPTFPKYKQFKIETLPFRAYFLINETNHTVHIANIVHTSRDISKLLS